MVKISIEGVLPRSFTIRKRELAAYARYFAGLSSRRCGDEFREVVIVLQDNGSSAEAHEAVMGVSGATDVITQPFDAMPGEQPGIYGELYVNCERAIEMASGRWTADRELLLYVAHGMDHLSGADDADAASAARMRRRELGWIRQAAGSSVCTGAANG